MFGYLRDPHCARNHLVPVTGKCANTSSSRVFTSNDVVLGAIVFSSMSDLIVLALSWNLCHRGQYLLKRQRGERCGVVGYPVGNHQLAAMHEAAAGVNDIGHVTIALV